MSKLKRAIMAAATLAAGSAWAYGGGGGGSSGCEEPKFLEPKPNGTAASLAEFAFIASDNTDPASLSVEVNGEKLRPAIERRRSGDYEVKASLAKPIAQPGRVRITVAAKSTDGCAGFQPWYLEIQP